MVIVAQRSAAPLDERVDGRGRIGLTVSRRVGGAVVRNRVKRRLREWFRASGARAAGALDWVVIARPRAGTLGSEALRAELDGLCVRALARGRA